MLHIRRGEAFKALAAARQQADVQSLGTALRRVFDAASTCADIDTLSALAAVNGTAPSSTTASSSAATSASATARMSVVASVAAADACPLNARVLIVVSCAAAGDMSAQVRSALSHELVLPPPDADERRAVCAHRLRALPSEALRLQTATATEQQQQQTHTHGAGGDTSLTASRDARPPTSDAVDALAASLAARTAGASIGTPNQSGVVSSGVHCASASISSFVH